MSTQKWTLNIAAMQEDFFTDTALIGIVSAMPAYRFCWMLNQKFDMNFVRDADSDIVKQDTDHQEHHFSIYKYCTPLNGNKYMIYKLKSDKETLLPEVKQLDYLWMIQSHDPEQDANQIAQYLKNIPDVQLAQVLMPEKLRNLSHLLV
ncbi:MAG: IPExxxVDY family protein [Chitinophagaceae bacterium]|nr:MAG: IPExxxVDY family protein [Chitinophagaceae bacterium]